MLSIVCMFQSKPGPLDTSADKDMFAGPLDTSADKDIFSGLYTDSLFTYYIVMQKTGLPVNVFK